MGTTNTFPSSPGMFPHPPAFLDFQSFFKNSLNALDTEYRERIFGDIYPDSDLCTSNGGADFAPIAAWYGRSPSPPPFSSSTPSPSLADLCRSYEKECLLNTNWTAVNINVLSKNVTVDLGQYCPKSPSTLTTTGFATSFTAEKMSESITKVIVTTAGHSVTGWRSATSAWVSHLSEWVSPDDRVPTNVIGKTTSGSFVYSEVAGETSVLPTLHFSNSVEEGHGQLKYLALLSLLLLVVAVVAVIYCIRKRQKNHLKELAASGSTRSSNVYSQSAPQSPAVSTTNLISPLSLHNKSKSKKKRREAGNINSSFNLDSGPPSRQLSLENDPHLSPHGLKSESETDASPTEDKEKERMFQSWTMRMDKIIADSNQSESDMNK